MRVARPTSISLSLLMTLNAALSCEPAPQEEGPAMKLRGGLEIQGQLEKTVVKILVRRQSGAGSVCSGALIKHDVVLTAAHCLRETGDRIDLGKSTVYFDEDYGGHLGFKDMYLSPITDVALIRLTKSTWNNTYFRLPTPCEVDNDSVAYHGTVLILGRRIDAKESDPDKYYAAVGDVASITEIKKQEGKYLLVQRSFIDLGDSGGPWIQNGTIVAVTFGRTAGTSLGARICDVTRDIEKKLKDWLP